MTTYIDSRLIVLNSKDAIKNNSSFNSDVNFPFLGLLKEEERDIIQVDYELINLQLPVSFYSINETNNILYYTLGTEKSISITKGNYNANSLITELQARFLLNGDSITVSINRITGILSFTSSSSFSFIKTNSSSFKLLGLVNDISSDTNIITAPYPLNLATINQILIKSNSLYTYSYSSSNNGGLSNIISTLSVNEPPFGILNYQSLNKQSRILRNKVINSIDILITDENGNLLNMNNVEWTITFSINILRRFNLASLINFNDIVKTGSIRNYVKEPVEEIKTQGEPKDVKYNEPMDTLGLLTN